MYIEIFSRKHHIMALVYGCPKSVFVAKPLDKNAEKNRVENRQKQRQVLKNNIVRSAEWEQGKNNGSGGNPVTSPPPP